MISVNETKTEIELAPEVNPDIIELECTEKENKVTLSDGSNTTDFTLKTGQKVHFNIHISEKEIAHIQFVGIEPNANFSAEYIKAHEGKNFVEIPEVSELANILLVLHKDAEKDHNMFDTKSSYYQKVKKYFAPYRNHPALEVIHKYMQSPIFNAQQNTYIFPMEAYKYYYALKMNACGYEFDNKGHIKNKGVIREIGQGWNDFDPMKDVAIFEDFARKSNFRNFYKENKPYYDQLLSTFNRLSPVNKMQQWLDKKFGFGYNSYMIYFSPLNKGAQATTQFEKGNFKQTFMFVCKSPEYEQYSPALNELLSSWIVFTEIDHNYVNPVSDKNLQYINRVLSNREKWAKGDVTNAYPDPYSVFNEYMTFGLFTLYAIEHYSQDEVMKFLPMYEPMMENVRGFIQFKEFNRALLERYQKNPDIGMNALFQYMMYWALQINDRE